MSMGHRRFSVRRSNPHVSHLFSVVFVGPNVVLFPAVVVQDEVCIPVFEGDFVPCARYEATCL